MAKSSYLPVKTHKYNKHIFKVNSTERNTVRRAIHGGWAYSPHESLF